MDLSIDPVAFITTECITVTSAMRKNTRWAASSTASILGGSTANARRTAKYLAQREGVKNKKKAVPGQGEEEGEEVVVKRWGLRPDPSKVAKPNPLMSAFARLRGDLKGCKDIHSFDVPALLHPFLQVVRSSSTSASITAFALIAITKFFSYRIIQRDSPRLPHGMQLLSAAITHCRFEASETTADEYVLQLILELMEDMLSGPGGELLSDESVCEMMETGLSMCCQSRLSEQLRRLAERKMVSMCQIIFERLKALETEEELEPEKESSDSKAEASTDLRMEAPLQSSTTATDVNVNVPTLAPNGADSETLREPSTDGRPSAETLTVPVQMNEESTPRPSEDPGADSVKIGKEPSEPAKIKPYSLPSIRELFRVLVNLLDPDDKQHTDAMRVMALRIIDVAIEVAGTSIGKHSSLASLARDDLCRNLFQLVRSENMALLNESLRVAGTLLATSRSVLKLQQELYLSYLVACLHPKIGVPHDDNIDAAIYEGVPQAPKLVKSAQPSSGRATPVPVQERQRLGLEGGMRRPEAREAMVENIGAFARIPSFIVELFVNYDCEVDRVDLCEDLVSLLARNAFPDAANWSTKNVPPLCLDSLLTYVNFIFDRLDQTPDTTGLPDPVALREQRRRKKLVIEGANKFNAKPKEGITWLVQQGILPRADDVDALTRFLRSTSRINKKVLGEFLTKRDSGQLLEAYIGQYDFKDQRLDEALRQLLGAFRLPGEGQLIDRIVETFAKRYMESSGCTEISPKGDGAHVLAFAIIMLNTDQHNPNLKKRQTFADFAKPLRDVNDGGPFEEAYLQKIYDAIRTNEIILPSEHDNKHSFEFAWKELLLKSTTAGNLVMGESNQYDADMFEATWKPIIATLSYVFMSATEDAVFERVLIGFEQCAEIAARYNLHAVLDHIIFCLGTISTLSVDTITSTALNTEVQVQKRKIMVSEMAVKFGRQPKAQLAAVLLFAGVVQGREDKIKNGWSHLVKIWLNLFANSQLPPLPESLKIASELPVLPVRTPGKVIDKDQQVQSAGLFSSFTSLITSYAADEPPEPSDEEVGDTIRTYECLTECQFDAIFESISTLPLDSITRLIQALLAQLPQDNDPILAVVKSESGPPSATRPNGQQRQAVLHQTTYNPAVAYILELASIIVIKNPAALEATGKDVVEALRDVLRNAGSSHPLIMSRTIFYLLHILSVSHDHSFVRAPVILHILDSLNQDMLDQSALPILKGIEQCLRGPKPLRNEIINTPDFWSIIRRLGHNTDVSGDVFHMLKAINDDSITAVTADNYEVFVLALNDYATAGSAGAMLEQSRDKARRMKQPVKALDIKGNEFVNRAIQAIGMVFKLSGRVSGLIVNSNLSRDEAWASYWTPIFRSLSAQCTNPCREVRNNAFASLQRALLSPEIAASSRQTWRTIFDDTMFPLVLTLLKPEVFHSDPAGMPETRVQASGLLCKVFLNYLTQLSEWDGMEELWLRILDIMGRLLNSGQPADAQVEALHESLKNTLLVMASGGFLAEEPAEAPATKLWAQTRKKLDHFQPEMVKEIFPERMQKRPNDATTTAAPVAPVGAGEKTKTDKGEEKPAEKE